MSVESQCPVKIAFMGDFMPGGLVVNDTNVCSQEIKHLLTTYDLRVCVLECAIGENLPFDSEKMERPDWRNIIYAPDHALVKLKELNINLVSLANNHIYDLSDVGLINTIKQLDNLGIQYVGAGLNSEKASSPAVFEIAGVTIAFLAYMEPTWRAPHPAGKDAPGINLFHIDKVVSDIKAAKRKYDYVFVLPHWGVEYTYYPLPSDRIKAKIMVEAGADGVFGSHTHQIQPYIKIDKSVVCFSLGNFLFPDFYMSKERPICYPTNTENIRATYEYPKNPASTVLRQWKHINRIGLIAGVTIKDKLSVKTTYVIINKDNHVEYYNSYITRFYLWLIGLSLHSDLYWFVYKIRGLFRRIKVLCSI